MNGAVLNDDQADWRLAYAIFPGNVAYVWHGGKHAGTVSKNLEDCGFEIVNQIIWNKQNFAFGRGDYHWKHEPCYYAVRKGKSHNWQGDRKQHTIWDISNLNPVGRSNDDNKDDKVEGHGTQKPIECMAKPIRNNTRKGDGVYDPFLGSGTTLIAAEQLNRICYGIELSPSYCDIIVKRWIKLMDKNNKSVIIKHNGKEINKEDLYGSNSKTS
jgi:DNA modification methylase